VVVVQLVCLPLGQGLAAILPTKHFNTFGYIWSLNPGPFSIKEHVCIAIMVGSGGSFVYSSYVILAQHLFYGQAPSMSFQILFAIGSQTLGFSFAGLLRQFVVWPSSMIWPGVLANCAFFNALHKNYGMHNPGHMTHKCFICIAVVGSFVWYWVPSYLFTGLSMFNWACWIAPKNVVINALFGINTGLGMSFLTFDWGIISGLVSPLVTPVGCIPFVCHMHHSHKVIPSGGSK
jgi:OPT family oligopeptide transporter